MLCSKRNVKWNTVEKLKDRLMEKENQDQKSIFLMACKIIAFLGILVVNILISGIALEILISNKITNIIALLINIGMYASLIFSLIYICRQQTWINKGGQSKWYKLVFNIIGFVLLLGVISLIFNALSSIIISNYHDTNNQNILNQLLANNQLKWFMIFQVSFLAPVIEELIFRGVLVKWFFKNRVKIQWILSAGTFALMHEQSAILAFLMYFFMGGILYRAREKLGLLGSIVIHVLYNSSLLFIFYII